MLGPPKEVSVLIVKNQHVVVLEYELLAACERAELEIAPSEPPPPRVDHPLVLLGLGSSLAYRYKYLG
jgi:hypothetical protein